MKQGINKIFHKRAAKLICWYWQTLKSTAYTRDSELAAGEPLSIFHAAFRRIWKFKFCFKQQLK
jgi:hypothetical protein